MYYPELKAPQQSQMVTQTFAGYDHNWRCREGAMYHMQNLSGRHYPLLSTRKPRKTIRQLTNPGGLIAKDALYWVDDGVFYANGKSVPGFTLTKGEKQMVSMGAYIVIWPDKKYINTQDLTEYGYLDNTFTTAGEVKVIPCRQDGEAYDMSEMIQSDAAPEDPANGQLWLDTSGDTHVLNIYSESAQEWVIVSTVYLRLEAGGIGTGFTLYDGVEISGVEYTGDSQILKSQAAALNGFHTLEAADTDHLVIAGLVDQSLTLAGITIKREAPALDYLCEANNRLWGCRYGMVKGEAINEIYACKLGDFKNWNCFMGLSTDSYHVSLGSDGVFTGAVNYQGYPVFFKETCMHRIYGAQPSSFQMQTLVCQGVARDSAPSLCQCQGVLYYKSRSAVMAYDGSLPQPISHALGEGSYTEGVGGSLGSLYYLSLLDEKGEPHLFVYDGAKALWYREDAERPLAFAQLDDHLYWITASALRQHDGGEEEMPWQAVTAVMGYEYPQQKYLCRWLIRAAAPKGAAIQLYVQYDSSGVWEPAGQLTGQGMARALVVPLIPRRCDHLQLRLSGQGEFKLFSLARVLEKGGDPLC